MDTNEEQYALDRLTTGPIVACDNAIQHYEKAIEAQVAETNNLRRRLSAALDTERTLEAMLIQWQIAKVALEREAAR